MSQAAPSDAGAYEGPIPSPTLGFADQPIETERVELAVEGSLPAWLEGDLVRTGPALWDIGGRTLSHWFDGLALLHRFEIAGGTISYASRYLESRARRSVTDDGKIAFSEFATDPCRGLFGRVMAMFTPQLSDNCNVNLAQLGERWIAMTETPIPIEFDGETLETSGVAYDVPGTLTTAHPHLDRSSGGMLNYAAKLGPRNSYRFFVLEPGAAKPQVIASVPVREPAYMHSFGVTERFIVLAEFPYVVNPLALAFSGRPYIENYRWKPERGTRITLIDRESGDAEGPFEIEPFFGFHHVNAFDDDDGSVVADIVSFDDAGIVDDLYIRRLRTAASIPRPVIRRCRIAADRGSVDVDMPLNRGFELPRINYGRCNGRPYRYAWGAGIGDSGWFDHLVAADFERGTSIVWDPPAGYPGEPVFVAEPGAADENAGALLSIVLDAAEEASYLVVLDAATLEELARARVPRHIPFGFHGQYAAA